LEKVEKKGEGEPNVKEVLKRVSKGRDIGEKRERILKAFEEEYFRALGALWGPRLGAY